MSRFVLLLFALLPAALLNTAAPAAEISAPRHVLPETLSRDTDLFARYWQWLLEDVGAPPDLAAPRITVEELPVNKDMALQYPTADDPFAELKIVVSPRIVQRARAGRRLEVLGGLAHETVHYVLLLAENQWNARKRTYTKRVRHHCSREFQRQSRHMGAIIWRAYHSSNALRAIDQMARHACRQNPAQ